MGTRNKYLTTGFRPIPMIFGAEGRRFMEEATHPKKLPKETIERMKRNYEIYKAAEERGRKIREEQNKNKWKE